MPLIETNGTKINVEVSGPDGAPHLMLSNSLGTNLTMWDRQAREFEKHFRLIRYDRRGHGLSPAPKGPYTYDDLGRDVLGILDALNVKTTNWCGLSMGGMVGQWLGAHAPGRVGKLVLSNTSSYYEDRNFWAGRIVMIKEKGLKPIVDVTMQRWFSDAFRAREPHTIARMTEIFLACDVEGYTGCCAAIHAMDFRESNKTIRNPTLVIIGKDDPATTPSDGERIAHAIPGALTATFDTRHIANVEAPDAYTKTVLDFLRS